MIKWRIVVGSAGFGFVLSLLTGAVSGVPFGALLFRGLLWGVLFAGIGAALSFLISRYLPELLTIAPPAARADEESGRNVDIVLPDENPHAVGGDDDADEGLEPDELDEQGTTLTREREEPAERVSTSLVEEVEELGPGPDEGTVRSRSQEGAGGVSADGELPELEDGDSLFSPRQSTASNGDFDDISSISGGRPGIELQGMEADPEDVARAIRTVLKRDRKG